MPKRILTPNSPHLYPTLKDAARSLLPRRVKTELRSGKSSVTTVDIANHLNAEEMLVRYRKATEATCTNELTLSLPLHIGTAFSTENFLGSSTPP